MKILVVDDVPYVREFMVAALKAKGHQPFAFGDAKSAWDWFNVNPCPLAILDWEMPGGMDGLGLCRWIRESHPKTYVLMLTGHDTVNERVEATKAGAHNLVSKPPSLQDLSETLQLAEWRVSQP